MSARPTAASSSAKASAKNGARAALLDRALAHVSKHGLGDSSLRAVAEQLGTSHRMLIYHFGSAEDFWNEVVARLQVRDHAALIQAARLGELPTLEETWAQLSSERYLPIARLVFELYGPALRDRKRFRGFLAQVLDGWLLAIAGALQKQYGLPAAQAKVQARMRLAVIRGLLLDLLTTGDRKGTTAALHLFADNTRFSPAAALRARRLQTPARADAPRAPRKRTR